MRVAFINPCLRPESKRRQLPVGLAYVMTAARRAGFDFELIDMDITTMTMDELERRVAADASDVYAVGCIVTGFRLVEEIAEIARRSNPEAVIIAGNSVATSIPEILLRNTEVDVAVMGEADQTIVELLAAIRDGAPLDDVAGLVFVRDGQVVATAKRPVERCLDDFGFPEWEIFDLDAYSRYARLNANIFSEDKRLSFPLNAARGCPYACTFCYHVFRGERYRKYSEESVMGEIRRLHDRYGCDFISFWDELTFPNLGSVKAMVERMEELDFGFGWEATTRGDLFRAEDVRLVERMRDLGCDGVSFSLENASPEILAAMNKRMDVAQFIEQSRVLWEGGVTPLTSVIFGYPQETPETIAATLEVCERCDIYPSVGYLLPMPATPIYEWAKERGIIGDEVGYLMRIGDRQDFHINLTSMPDEEFVGLVETGLQGLAAKLGLELESVMKTVTYQKPKVRHADDQADQAKP